MAHSTFRVAGGAILTDEVQEYTLSKLARIEKILGADAAARFDIELTTHTNARTGSEFSCAMNVHHKDGFHRAEASASTMHACIDDCVDELRHEVEHTRGRARDLIRKGARTIKNLFRRG